MRRAHIRGAALGVDMNEKLVARAADIWSKGMREGNGSAVGHDGDAPHEAAIREGWKVLVNDGETVIAKDGPDEIVVMMAPLWDGEVEHAWAIWVGATQLMA